MPAAPRVTPAGPERDDLAVTPDRSAPAGPAHPPWFLVAMGALAGAVAVVALLGMTIARGHQFAFDRAILLLMREPENMRVPEGPVWLKQAMLDITALGSVTVLVLVVALTLGLLIVLRHWLTAALVFGGTVSGALAVAAIKTLVGRQRPALIDHLVTVGDASFPSGHAANSAVVYLTLALLLLQITERRAARRYLFVAAILLVTAIGCSRVYLGVHWPSDVLAGWSFGALWALAWWAVGAWVRAGARRSDCAGV